VAIRSYPLTMVADRGALPASLFDPRWKDPAVGARVAFEVFRKKASTRDGESTRLVALESLPTFRNVDYGKVKLAIGAPTPLPELGREVRGIAVNELHRRYAYGGKVPARNYHAQVVTFAFDRQGRWLLRAFVGRFGGTTGDRATLLAKVWSGSAIGGAMIQHLLGEKDQEVVLAGQDERLAAAFDAPIDIELGLGISTGLDEEPDRSLDETLAAFDK
jgi:hypothetical protein